MKRSLISFFILAISGLAFALIAASPAQATTGAHGPRANARADSAAYSGAEASAGANAAGGASTAGGGSSTAVGGAGGAAGSSLSDNSQSNSRALALFLPPPVHTPPLPKIDCPSANVEQSSMSVGLGVYSQARGSINSDNCALFSGYNAYVSACQYRSAKMLLDMTMQRIVANFAPTDMDLTDYTPEQCRVLTAPPPAAAPVREVAILTAPAPSVVVPLVATVAPAKVRTTKSARRPQIVATDGRFGNQAFDCTRVCAKVR